MDKEFFYRIPPEENLESYFEKRLTSFIELQYDAHFIHIEINAGTKLVGRDGIYSVGLFSHVLETYKLPVPALTVLNEPVLSKAGPLIDYLGRYPFDLKRLTLNKEVFNQAVNSPIFFGKLLQVSQSSNQGFVRALQYILDKTNKQFFGQFIVHEDEESDDDACHIPHTAIVELCKSQDIHALLFPAY